MNSKCQENSNGNQVSVPMFRTTRVKARPKYRHAIDLPLYDIKWYANMD